MDRCAITREAETCRYMYMCRNCCLIRPHSCLKSSRRAFPLSKVTSQAAFLLRCVLYWKARQWVVAMLYHRYSLSSSSHHHQQHYLLSLICIPIHQPTSTFPYTYPYVCTTFRLTPIRILFPPSITQDGFRRVTSSNGQCRQGSPRVHAEEWAP